MKKFSCKYLIVGCLTFVSLLGTSNFSNATTIKDQGSIFGTDGEIILGIDTWSQSITTGVAGELQGIEFQIANFTSFDPTTFNFSIFSGPNPTGGIALFSQQIVISQSDVYYDSVITYGGGLYKWDVSSANLGFDINDVFTFDFNALQSGITIAGNYQQSGSGYASGELYKNGLSLPVNESDMGFRTYVAPVPEPATMLLFGLGLLGLAGVNRRKK